MKRPAKPPKPNIVTMPLALIDVDPAVQPRVAGLHGPTVAEYRERRAAGDEFPPLVVYGTRRRAILSEGFHRHEMYRLDEVAEVVVELRPGDHEAAVLNALASNAAHGLKRTNADKRRAVERLLALRAKWSDRKVADHCGVGHTFVADIRKGQVESDATCQPQQREGKDGKTYTVPAKPAPDKSAAANDIGHADPTDDEPESEQERPPEQESERSEPGPIVCAPVGSARLSEVAGITAQDVACLSAVGMRTLADLERVCDGNLDRLPAVLERWGGAFTPSDRERIVDAVTRHLRPSTPAEPELPAVLRCKKCKATFNTAGRSKCPSCSAALDAAPAPDLPPPADPEPDPPEHPAEAVVTRMNALCRRLDDLRAEVRELAADPHGKHVHGPSIDAQLEAARKALWQSRPTEPCTRTPECGTGGGPCKACYGTGRTTAARAQKGGR